MGTVALPKPRATVSTQTGALQIVIPSRKNVFPILFLSCWLVGWFIGESTTATALIKGGVRADAAAFTMFWLAGWSIGGALAVTTWLWMLIGREVLTFGSGEFVHRRALGPFGLDRAYAMSQVRDLRAVPTPAYAFGRRSRDPFGLTSGTIAFDYGAKTIGVGAGIDEAEAKQLVETIRNRCRL